MLLDALMRLRQQDDTLAFGRAAASAVSSDAMNINGRTAWRASRLKEVKEPVELRRCQPVIRDLIVDIVSSSSSTTRSSRTWPTIRRRKGRLQSPGREELDGLYECILCASPPHVLRSGERTSLSGRRGFLPPRVSSPTAGISPPASASTTSRTHRLFGATRSWSMLSQEPQSDQGHRQDQGPYGEAGSLGGPEDAEPGTLEPHPLAQRGDARTTWC
jgi:hypothetical protein